MCTGSKFPTSWPTCDVIWLFDSSQPSECEVVSPCGFDLHRHLFFFFNQRNLFQKSLSWLSTKCHWPERIKYTSQTNQWQGQWDYQWRPTSWFGAGAEGYLLWDAQNSEGAYPTASGLLGTRKEDRGSAVRLLHVASTAPSSGGFPPVSLTIYFPAALPLSAPEMSVLLAFNFHPSQHLQSFWVISFLLMVSISIWWLLKLLLLWASDLLILHHNNHDNTVAIFRYLLCSRHCTLSHFIPTLKFYYCSYLTDELTGLKRSSFLPNVTELVGWWM